MGKRAWIVGGAVVVSAGVLLLALVAGPESPEGETAGPSESMRADLPTGAETSPPTAEVGVNPIGQGEEGRLAVNKDGRLTVIYYEAISPKPEFVYDVVRPRAVIYFSASRALELVGREGTVVAPENQPRRGELRGDVVLTMYEDRGGKALDFEDRAALAERVRLKVYLEDAAFDLELGQVDSPGSVHLTGPTVDFRGRGLSLNYNQLRERLERLEVAQGERLRFRVEEDAEEEERTQEDETTRPFGVAPEEATPQDRREEGAEPHDRGEETDETTQVYRARFQKNVRVVTDDEAVERRVTMTGDELAVVFALEEEGDGGETPGPSGAAGATDSGPTLGAPGPSASPEQRLRTGVGAADSGPVLEALPGGQSLMVEQAGDVVVTWTGKLVVQPFARGREQIEEPGEAVVSMQGSEGRPVRIETGRREVITAARAEYVSGRGRLRAVGEEESPVRVVSPVMGEVTGRTIVLNERSGTGVVQGPGWLRGNVKRGEGAAEHVEVAWTERLDLTFFQSSDRNPEGSKTRPSGLGGGMGAIRTATFRGGATVEHPRFRIAGDEVGLTLTEPGDAGDGGSTIDRLRGQGNVQLFAQAEDPADRLDLTANELDIDFAEGPGGELYPAEVTAVDRVVVKQPNQALRSGRLELATAPKAAGSADSGSGAARDRLSVARMLASGGVEVEVAEPALRVFSDRLTVGEGGDRIEVFGVPGTQARVEQADGMLWGDHLIVGQASGAVDVIGAGHIDMAMGEDRPGEVLRVDWRESMRYDRAAALAEFRGGVVAKTESPTERNTLTTKELRLEFEDDPAVKVNGAEGAKRQRVRRAVAVGNGPDDSQFIADTFAAGAAAGDSTFLTRFRLHGATMTFDNRAERVEVPGAGMMLVSDRRPTQERRPIADGRATEVVEVKGRGDTLFTWKDRLTMDARENVATITGKVEITHRPAKTMSAPEPQPVLFWAERVSADLTNAKGLNDWMDKSAPKPELTKIEAHDGVRIIDKGRGYNITADDLVYEEKSGDVVLTGKGGKLVHVENAKRPLPVTGKTIKYNPRTGTVDILEMGTMGVPVEGKRRGR